MAVKIKLKRLGKIREPYYRIVVADARTKRDGRAIEEIGKYHPKAEPSFIEVNSERAQHWLSVGAQPTDPVSKILEVTGDWQKFKGLPGAEGTLQVAAPQAATEGDLRRRCGRDAGRQRRHHAQGRRPGPGQGRGRRKADASRRPIRREGGRAAKAERRQGRQGGQGRDAEKADARQGGRRQGRTRPRPRRREGGRASQGRAGQGRPGQGRPG